MLAIFSSVGTNGRASFAVPSSRTAEAAPATSGEPEDVARGATTTALGFAGAPTPGGVPSEHATRAAATSEMVLSPATSIAGVTLLGRPLYHFYRRYP
jgi:hypothetical protein